MKRRVNWDNKDNDYVTEFISKKEMDYEFAKSKDAGVWTEKAGELIITLVENVAFSKYFKIPNSKFIIREAMIDYAILAILTDGLRLYNPSKSAFSYFTQMTFSRCYDFLRRTNGDNKRVDIYGYPIRYKVNNKWVNVTFETLNEYE